MDKISLIKSCIEKNQGDRTKTAKELGYSVSYISKIVKLIVERFPNWEHSNKNSFFKIFPTNKERLYYLDNPERSNIRGRLKKEPEE